MDDTTKFLLDSGDPDEYREIAALAKEKGSKLWGATTNPTLIAKKLSGQKFTQYEAFELQKKIVIEILEIVPGAVSAEVYADENTTSEDMIEQGKEIATWHDRVVVKLPTTVEGFKARTQLRKKGIVTNNTLVFSQQQIFAICLHEQIIQNEFKPKGKWPPFISPFVGRLDDQGENGMTLVTNGMKIKNLFTNPLWMLEASVRTMQHIQQGIEANSELITAPAKTYRQWFSDQTTQAHNTQALTITAYWDPPKQLFNISSIEDFMHSLVSKQLDISHPLTDKGIIRFAKDWSAIVK